MMRVLVLGATGMFGHAAFRVLSEHSALEVWGTIRSDAGQRHFAPSARARLVDGVNANDFTSVVRAFEVVRPNVVVNAIGVVKQLSSAEDPLVAIPLNALFPHLLSSLCAASSARVIHVSTDCVFSGSRGSYTEADNPDAHDLYGRSKAMGELTKGAHAVTLRTSGIGRELGTRRGLVEWFLGSTGEVKGYANAIYSGLPWVEVSRVIRDVVIPRSDLSGLYHLASSAISKLDLLRLIAERAGKDDVAIVPDESVTVDRSMDASRFAKATGYVAAPWPDLVSQMFESQWK